MEIILMDTDFVFEYLNNNPEAIAVFNKHDKDVFMLSFTSHAELYKACTNKEKMQMLAARLRKTKLITIHIDEEISENSLKLIEEYHLSNAASIPDSLIAATALKYDCYLATCNKKHFDYIPKLKLLQHDVVPKSGGFLGV